MQWSNEDIAFIMENSTSYGDMKAIAVHVYGVRPESLWEAVRYYKNNGMRK